MIMAVAQVIHSHTGNIMETPLNFSKNSPILVGKMIREIVFQRFCHFLSLF
ncbi:hypothetical protein VHA_002316 [Grimontia hollisae CIP 101886]|uniref:Uncharacterized protein n=1 Tax=Grimontia hollisae CIP 101886 TaxID=675812 RepID=D0I8X9_GRIHO|nr:hypothetical protein VHA_002316 [Grimontia hollisae CIP 101886]